MTIKELIPNLSAEDAENMKACADQDAVYAYLQTKGLTDSKDAFKAAVVEMNGAVSMLTADEIDAVSGGMKEWEAVAVGVAGSAGAGLVVAAICAF